MKRVVSLALALGLGCGSPPEANDAATFDAGVDAAAIDAWVDPCQGVTGARVETVGMLSSGRYAPAVARLGDGRVLIIGGYDFTLGMTGTSELYDPVTHGLTPGPTFGARNFASATVVPGGVIIAGGFDQSAGSVGYLERYDEASGAEIALDAFLANVREAHTATLLPSGQIVIAGGLRAQGLRFQSSLERYDPATDTMTRSAAMLMPPRGFHDAVMLDEDVLLVGGDSGMGELASAVRYRPATDTLVATANDRAHAGKAVAAVRLPSGHVLVAGGASATDGTLADVDDYDPATDRFTAVSPMSVRRMAHTLTLLDDGRVVAIGGWSDTETAPGGGAAATASIEVRDVGGTWSRLPVSLAVARLDHRTVAIDACHVVLIGGQHAATGEMPSAPREVELVTIPR